MNQCWLWHITNLIILSAERQYCDGREDRQCGEEADENGQDPYLKKKCLQGSIIFKFPTNIMFEGITFD